MCFNLFKLTNTSSKPNVLNVPSAPQLSTICDININNHTKYNISLELATFLGVNPNIKYSIIYCNKCINIMMFDNNLIDPDNYEYCFPNEKFKNIMNLSSSCVRISRFEVSNNIIHHFSI